MNPILPLEQVQDFAIYGGKALRLGQCLREGLPVPRGFAIPPDVVELVARHDHDAMNRVEGLIPCPVIVRSSPLGQDGVTHSLLGQYLTVAGITRPLGVTSAIRSILQSVLPTRGERRIAAIIQPQVQARTSGCIHTKGVNDPEGFIIEAAGGLVEAVTQGLVEPDVIRVTSLGQELSYTPGNKILRVDMGPHGGTIETHVWNEDASLASIHEDEIQDLVTLAVQCEAVFGRNLDIEWSIDRDGSIVLLQVRSSF